MQYSENDIKRLIESRKDQKVIAILYKQVLPRVKKYINRNSGNDADAMDVFQESILKLYKKVFKTNVAIPDNVAGYLYQMCIHTWVRKASQKNRTSPLNEDLAESIESNDERIYSSEGNNLLEKTFKNLGEKCLELLSLSIYSEISQEDIMLRMGFSTLGAVKMQHKRCKEKLIETIKKKPELIHLLKHG